MNEFIKVLNGLISASASQISGILTGFAPKIIFALAVILTGWLLAAVIRKIISIILKALGFNVFAEKVGLESFLKRGGVKKSPSFTIGTIFYWIIVLNAFIAAADVFQTGLATGLLEQIFITLPKIFAFIIILSLGIIVGKFISKIISGTVKISGLPFNNVAGALAGYSVVALSFLLALDYMNIARFVFVQISIIIIAIIPVFILLLILTGGRDIVANILSFPCIKKELKIGDIIELYDESGEIVAIGPVFLKLKKDNKFILIPNSKIVGEGFISKILD